VSQSAERYRQLLQSLVAARKESTGVLPSDVEGRYMKQLDDCWMRMTESERVEATSWYGRFESGS